MLLGCNQFLRLLHVLLVLLALLFLLLRLLGFLILRRLAVGGSLVHLLLELRHVGQESGNFLDGFGNRADESGIEFFGQPRERERHDAVLRLVLETVRLRQYGYRHACC